MFVTDVLTGAVRYGACVVYAAEGETVAEIFYRGEPHLQAPKLAPDSHGLIYLPEEAFGTPGSGARISSLSSSTASRFRNSRSASPGPTRTRRSPTPRPASTISTSAV